ARSVAGLLIVRGRYAIRLLILDRLRHPGATGTLDRSSYRRSNHLVSSAVDGNAMSFFEISAIILTLAAVASYFNYRFLRLPPTIGLMLIPLVASLLLILVSKLGLPVDAYVRPVLRMIDFNEVLFNGMLSFLLFAG